MRLNFFQTLSRYPNEFAIRETRPEELLTPAKSVIIERNEGKTKGFDGNFNSFSLSRFQASFDHILPFPNERGRFHDVVHVFFLLSYFFLFCLTRSKERERGEGRERGGWKAGLARHPEIQGSSNKLEPWTERKARRARFHARLPFLYLPRLHIRACRNNRQPLLRFKGIILQTFSPSSFCFSFSFFSSLRAEPACRMKGREGGEIGGEIV